jgi:enoyl-CoA hydratase/carnithine racemase
LPAHNYETVLVEIDDAGVATLTLNRPDRLNAFNLTMDREFHAALWALDADEGVRAIIVTGAGRAFCSGIDLERGAGTFDAEYHAEHDATLGVDADSLANREAFGRMVTPIIGAINGAAIGAGLTVPLLFDVNFVAEDAKLAFVFTRRAMAPDAGATWFLPRLVGLPRAMDLLLSGRTFSGRDAAAMGMVAAAVPTDQVLATAQAYARDLAENTAPMSVAVTKRLINRFLEQGERDAAIAQETKVIWWLGEQPDAVEGVMSFLEKRRPEWKGSKHVDLPPDIAL